MHICIYRHIYTYLQIYTFTCLFSLYVYTHILVFRTYITVDPLGYMSEAICASAYLPGFALSQPATNPRVRPSVRNSVHAPACPRAPRIEMIPTLRSKVNGAQPGLFGARVVGFRGLLHGRDELKPLPGPKKYIK